MVHFNININWYNDGSTFLDRLFLKSPKERIFSLMVMNVMYVIVMSDERLNIPALDDLVYYLILLGIDIFTLMIFYVEIINIRELFTNTISSNYSYGRWKPQYKILFQINELEQCDEIIDNSELKTYSMVLTILLSILLLPITILILTILILFTCFQIIIIFFEYSMLTILLMFGTEYITDIPVKYFLPTVAMTSLIIMIYLFGVYIYTLIKRDRVLALLGSDTNL